MIDYSVNAATCGEPIRGLCRPGNRGRAAEGEPRGRWHRPQAGGVAARVLGPVSARSRGSLIGTGRFGCEVLDVVALLVPIVKFQSAFYEAFGPEGVSALHASVEYAKQSGLIVILDGKRNDIGSTAEAYARAYLGKVPIGGAFENSWHADALTVNPYLGTDGVMPFVRIAAREHKGIFVLVRTSNPSAGEFQDLNCDGRPLFRHVAQKLREWAGGYKGQSGYHLVGAVVGATYPQELSELRADLPGILFLVPGYGTQGGGQGHCRRLRSRRTGRTHQQFAWNHVCIQSTRLPGSLRCSLAGGNRGSRSRDDRRPGSRHPSRAAGQQVSRQA